MAGETAVLLADDALARGFSTPIEALHLVYNPQAMPPDLVTWQPAASGGASTPTSTLRHAYTTSERLAAFLFVGDAPLAKSLMIHGWSREVLETAGDGSLPPELAPLATRDLALTSAALLGQSVVVLGDGGNCKFVPADGHGEVEQEQESKEPPPKRTRVPAAV